MALFPLSMSWARWREGTATVQRRSFPQILIDNSDWLLPKVGCQSKACLEMLYAISNP
jgi:hypothetical protein